MNKIILLLTTIIASTGLNLTAIQSEAPLTQQPDEIIQQIMKEELSDKSNKEENLRLLLTGIY